MQGRGLAGTPPAFGAGVAAAVGQVGARLVHEFETGEILGLHRFDKGRPQGPHPFSVALGGVDTLFFRRQSSAATARPSMARLTAGPPTAASQMPNSSSVASGCCRTQAPNCARAGASKHGAGPLRWGSAASEPLRRWRCNSLATNDTDTLNRAATAPTVRPGC